MDDDEYRSVVRARLDEDDFIEDDDGSGYVDHGEEDDWNRPSDDENGSDDGECHVDVQDASIHCLICVAADDRAKRKKKATKAKKDNDSSTENADPRKQAVKPKKPLPPPRPILANPYKKEISAAREDDFMSDLLGDLDKAPRSPSPPLKKRKATTANGIGSNGYGAFRGSHAASSANTSFAATSSDPVMGDTSSFAETGPSSDGLFDIANGPDTSRSSKKARLSGAEDTLGNLDLDNSYDMVDNIAMDLFPEDKKAKKEDDDDEVAVKAVRKAKAGRRHLVNTTATRVNVPIPSSAEEAKPDIKPVTSLQDRKKVKGMDWQLAAAAVTLEGDEEGNDTLDGEDIFSAADSSATASKTKKMKAPSAGGGSLKTAKVQALEEDGSVRFYWLDYVETNGVLHFIGKVFDKESKKYVSCCLTVEGIDRNLFVLPREGGVDGKIRSDHISLELRMSSEYGNETAAPTEDEVYEEFGRVASKNNITEWMGKQVDRKYAFELPDVPQEASYLKVLYSYDRTYSWQKAW